MNKMLLRHANKWSYISVYYRPLLLVQLQTFKCCPLTDHKKRCRSLLQPYMVECHLISSHFVLSGFFLSQFLQEMMLFFARSLTRVPPLQSQTCVVENRPHNQRHSNFKVEVITNNKIFIAVSYSIRKLK